MSTKLGCALGVKLLNAPVADPGLMRMRSSCCIAWVAKQLEAQNACLADSLEAPERRQLCWRYRMMGIRMLMI